jgi:D-threo-aldose 1-dehydrogenase
MVYLHDSGHTSFENIMALGGAVEVMQHYKEQGIVEHIDVAGGPVDLMIRYVETRAFEAVITHNRYTLVNRSANPLLDSAAERGLALVSAALYGSGMLAKEPDADPRYAYQDAPSDLVEYVRRLAAICPNYEVPLAAAALQFSLRDRCIDTTIIGSSRPERIAQMLHLAAHSIPENFGRNWMHWEAEKTILKRIVFDRCSGEGC